MDADPFGLDNNTMTNDELREHLLSMRAQLQKNQGTVAALKRKIDKADKEVRKLKKAHKRKVAKLNYFIAHVVQGTRCMPLRTNEPTFDQTDDDDDEEQKAAPAAVAQEADHT